MGSILRDFGIARERGAAERAQIDIDDNVITNPKLAGDAASRLDLYGMALTVAKGYRMRDEAGVDRIGGSVVESRPPLNKTTAGARGDAVELIARLARNPRSSHPRARDPPRDAGDFRARVCRGLRPTRGAQ